MIRAFFFDIGNVLIHVHMEKMFAQIEEISGISQQQATEILLMEGPGYEYERGHISTSTILQTFKQLSSKSYRDHDLIHALCHIFQPNESIFPLIYALKKTGIPLILISNTCEIHFEYLLQHYDIIKLFDHAVLSYTVGARKPHYKIFKHALDLTKAKPDECFYTDDIAAYVYSAKQLGIDAECFTNTLTLINHFKIRGLEIKI